MSEAKGLNKSANDSSPRSYANCISRLFIWWTIPLFRKCNAGNVGLEDMFPLPKGTKSEELGYPLLKAWRWTLERDKPSFRSAFLQTYLWSFLGLGVVFVIKECILQVGVTLVFAQFLRVYGLTSPENLFWSIPAVYWFGGLYILVSFLYAITSSHFTLSSMELGGKMATSIAEVIYRKTLRITVTSINAFGSGKLTNLIASDTKRFETGVGILHSLWVGPLLIVIVLYLLWTNYGLDSFAGLAAVFVLSVTFGIMGKGFSILRGRIAKLTDFRLKLIEELVSGIRLIKIYTWERLVLEQVNEVRREELRGLSRRNWLIGFSLNIQTLFSRITILTTLFDYVFLGSNINVEKVFVVMSFYNMISGIMSGSFPSALLQLVEINVAFKRIQSLLLLPEKRKRGGGGVVNLNPEVGSGSVSLTNFSGKWDLSENSPGVEGINLEARTGRPTFIVGQVSSGKSTLLAGILGNLELGGDVDIRGTVAYVPQTPWAFDGTIRDNILLGRDYEAEWYNQVLQMCALVPDVERLPLGDQSPVGDRGMMLSGGQRTRLNLARAVYSKADVFLLDDILSSLDSNVGGQIFENVVRGHLKNKCVVMATHSYTLGEDENIILIKDGKILAEGTQSSLECLGYTEFFQPVKPKSSTEEPENLEDPNLELGGHSQVELPKFNKSIETRKKFPDDNNKSEVIPLLQIPSKIDYKEAQNEGGTDLGLLCWKFLRSGNGICTIFFGTTALLTSQILISLSDLWINMWSNAEEHVISVSDTKMCFTIYGLLILSSFLIGAASNIFYFAIGLSSARKLHGKAINSIIMAPMIFFEQNSAGTVLNRFSKDTSNVDEYLPMTMFGAINCGLQVLGVLVVACILNPTLAPPVLVLLWVFVRVRRFYLRASSKIKRLEAIARSPVFTLFNATVDGISTIQAFQQEDFFLARFRRLKNEHSSAFFSYIATYIWFTLTLNLLIVLFQLFVVFAFIVFVSNKAGAALVMTSVFSMSELFSATAQRSADLENDLISVERLQEYRDLRPEGRVSTEHWHEKTGRIEARNLNVVYGSSSNPILTDVSFSISGGEKIGIVGRTGSGKSSLVWALLRLVEPSEGCILIDGVDTRNLSLKELRSNISVIPQSPGFLRGTLRKNIDPFDKHSDMEVWTTLESLGLASKVKALPGTILHQIENWGSVFSQGEQQLISVARVLLEDNCILITDEASASIDSQTEEIMENVIRERFQISTVIMIAHRTQTLIHCDRVCLLEDGRVIAFDKPDKIFEALQDELTLRNARPD